MSRDRFRMAHGAGYHSTLWRVLLVGPHAERWVWRDAPPGEKPELQFDDDEGRPVDDFGLPIFGEFID